MNINTDKWIGNCHICVGFAVCCNNTDFGGYRHIKKYRSSCQNPCRRRSFTAGRSLPPRPTDFMASLVHMCCPDMIPLLLPLALKAQHHSSRKPQPPNLLPLYDPLPCHLIGKKKVLVASLALCLVCSPNIKSNIYLSACLHTRPTPSHSTPLSRI